MSERDECRPVTLPSGETIRLRCAAEPAGEALAMVGEIVEAARRKYAAEHVDDPGAPQLWARIDAVLDTGLSLRGLARAIELPFSVLFRIGQGRMPAAGDLARIEAWLDSFEPTHGLSPISNNPQRETCR